jgi:chromosome segregation ATPase
MMIERNKHMDAARVVLREHAPETEHLLKEMADVHAENIRLEKLQENFDKAVRMGRVAAERAEYLEREVGSMKAEIATKTAALRAADRDSDQARFDAKVEERVAAATAALRAELSTSRTEIAELKSKVSELTSAKKRLREALERLKGER